MRDDTRNPNGPRGGAPDDISAAPPSAGELEQWRREAREAGATEAEAEAYVREMAHQTPNLYGSST